MDELNFIIECHVCGSQYGNWVGSTPCCGALGYVIYDKLEERTKKINKILDNIKKSCNFVK